MPMKKIALIAAVLVLTGAVWIHAQEGGVMKITSPEFKHNEYIPKKFTCQGQGINPALKIEDLPKESKSLAFIMDDPDAPAGTFIHWVLFDIKPTSEIKENSIPGKQGSNDSGRNNYCSPCPPFGTHRYFFKVYALDTMLNLAEGISKADLEKAIQGHILASAELIGLYKK
jgi:Raf kinase inhibitor-like YbhB/YbcL family protein